MDGNPTPQEQPELPPVVQPGQTINPGGQPVAAPSSQPPAPPAEPLQSAPAAPQPTPPQAQPVVVTSNPQDYATEEVPIRGRDEAPAMPPTGYISWTASEFIAHEKSSNWYVMLIGGAVIAAGIVWLLTKDIVSSVVILIAVGVLAAYSSRQPRELQYSLDDEGITIGEKHYPYTNFRSFSLAEEGAFSSIELMPLKRFTPPISIYYEPTHEDEITAALTPHLPFQPHKPDAIDQLVRRIRF